MKFHLLISWLAVVPVCFAGDYALTIERVLIRQTRSAGFDNLIGAITIAVRAPKSDPMVWNATKVLGNHGGGGPEDFILSNFGIHFSAPDNANVEISIAMVNKANASGTDSGGEYLDYKMSVPALIVLTALLDGLFAAVGKGIDAFIGDNTFETLGSAIDTFFTKLGSFQDLCDGTVIADAQFRTPSDLQNITAQDEAQSVQNLGGDSPMGCGSNSDYTFWYRIHHQNPPNTVTSDITIPSVLPDTMSFSVTSTPSSAQNTITGLPSAVRTTSSLTTSSTVQTSTTAATSLGSSVDILVIPGALLVTLSVFTLVFSVVISN
jgi:hypothetical protein